MVEHLFAIVGAITLGLLIGIGLADVYAVFNKKIVTSFGRFSSSEEGDGGEIRSL